MRMVTAMQDKCSYKKGYVMFVVHIYSDKGKDVEDEKIFNRYPILHQFQDVFPTQILELPPHKEVEFSIDLVQGHHQHQSQFIG